MADHTDVFFRQKCDTFSRSNTAVFELSTRFSQPQPIDANISAEDQLKKNKLLFHELTQGAFGFPVCKAFGSSDGSGF